MTTWMFVAACMAQPPVVDPPPPTPPKVDRRAPPPIPRPPSEQASPNVQPGGPVPQTLEQAPPPPPQRNVRHIFLRHHDVNADGRLEPAELERRFARHFATADRNGDGYLDANEILYDRRNIGKVARRMDGLDLDREGRLVFKGDKAPLPIANIARGVIDSLDPNRDGFIDGREVGDAVKMEVLPRIMEVAPPPTAPPPADIGPNALPTRPSATDAPPGTGSSNPKTPPPVPTPPVVAGTGQGSPPPTTAKKKADELPSADQMIAHLDKDGDGQLNGTEAIDQLAKNFKTLDKNRDGRLSKEEIDRGLRLARLFGIKPMKPPQSYKDGSASKGQAPLK